LVPVCEDISIGVRHCAGSNPGGIALVKARMSALIQDLKYGARALLQRPAFAAVAILTLALGIGANTAIFSIVDAVVVKPLPFPDARRLVVLWESNDRLNLPFMNVAPPNFADWRTRSRAFEGMGACRRGPRKARGEIGPSRRTPGGIGC
jgi:hypothetical protein